jgi:hypothetical protein
MEGKAMKNPEAALSVQSTLTPAYLEKVDAWAEKLGYPRAKMIRLLVEAAVDDQGWILNLITSRIGLKLVDMARGDEKPRAAVMAVESHG